MYCACHAKCILPDPLQMSHACHRFWTCYKTVTFPIFGKVQNPLHLQRKTSSEPSKAVRACGVFNILTWKGASRHNGMHFFDISTSKRAPKLVCLHILTWKYASRHNGARFFDSPTSKSAPTLVCFAHFDFEMCFAPQHRAKVFISHLAKLTPHPPL